MIQLLIHTLKKFFADPNKVYLSESTDLVDLERRMKRIHTKSFRMY